MALVASMSQRISSHHYVRTFQTGLDPLERLQAHIRRGDISQEAVNKSRLEGNTSRVKKELRGKYGAGTDVFEERYAAIKPLVARPPGQVEP